MNELLMMIRKGYGEAAIEARARELFAAGKVTAAEIRQVRDKLGERVGLGEGMKQLGLRGWGSLQGVGFNLLDDAANLLLPGEPGTWLQDMYEEEVPFWQRVGAEAMGDVALLLASGGAAAPAIAAKKAGAKGVQGLSRAAAREAASSARIAAGEAAEDIARRRLRRGFDDAADDIVSGSGLFGRAAKKKARESGDAAANWMSLAAKSRVAPESAGAKAFDDLVRTKGLMHPGDLGAFDMARRYETTSFPISRGLMNVGRRAWDVARHGRIRPGSYEDLSPPALTLADYFSKGRQARFIEEGLLFGGLEGLGQSDFSEADSFDEGWSRASRGTGIGMGLGAVGGLGIGNVANLGGYVRSRLKHFRRPETSEEVMRDAITDLSGVRSGVPTRIREEQLRGEAGPLVEEAMATPFTERASDVSEQLGLLRSQGGVSSIPREITSGATRTPNPDTPMRVGGLMSVASDLGSRNRDYLGDIRSRYERYLTELGDDAVQRGDIDQLDEMHLLALNRPGDRPRAPFAGGLDKDNVFTGQMGLETPGADHIFRQDLPAGRDLQEFLSYHEGDTGLLAQAVQRHMPESVNVFGRPAEVAPTYGTVAEIADRLGQRHATMGRQRGLLDVAEREEGFRDLMSLRGRLDTSERRIDALKRAELDSGRLDRLDESWESARGEFAGDPDAMDAYGRGVFESLLDRLSREPADARAAFRQLLGGSRNVRSGIVRMIRDNPEFKNWSPGRKQNLINEIAMIANTEATLSRGANNVVDFLIRRAAGVSTRWSAVGSVSSDLGGNAGRQMQGRKR